MVRRSSFLKWRWISLYMTFTPDCRFIFLQRRVCVSNVVICLTGIGCINIHKDRRTLSAFPQHSVPPVERRSFKLTAHQAGLMLLASMIGLMQAKAKIVAVKITTVNAIIFLPGLIIKDSYHILRDNRANLQNFLNSQIRP